MKLLKGTLLALAAIAAAAHAGETVQYTYDAKGQLVRVDRTGSVNSGNTVVIQYDAAGNRTAYQSSRILFRQSFESGIPAFTHKSDGGWVYPATVGNSPGDGSNAVRFGMVGSHNWHVASHAFVASESTVTLSILVRDSGVTNSSLTNWSGSSVNASAYISLGLYNVTTGVWDVAPDWSTFYMPQAGGAWERYTRTMTNLQVGHTYSPAIYVDPYYGQRAIDVDVWQVEYGPSATPL